MKRIINMSSCEIKKDHVQKHMNQALIIEDLLKKKKKHSTIDLNSLPISLNNSRSFDIYPKAEEVYAEHNLLIKKFKQLVKEK